MKKAKVIIQGVLVVFLMLQAGNAVCMLSSLFHGCNASKNASDDFNRNLEGSSRPAEDLENFWLKYTRKELIRKTVETYPHMAPIFDRNTSPEKMMQIMNPKDFYRNARKYRKSVYNKKIAANYFHKAIKRFKTKIEKEKDALKKVKSTDDEDFNERKIITFDMETINETIDEAKKKLSRSELTLQTYQQQFDRAEKKTMGKEYFRSIDKMNNDEEKLNKIVAGVTQEKAKNENNPYKKQYKLFVKRSELLSKGKSTAEIDQKLFKLIPDPNKRRRLKLFFEKTLAVPIPAENIFLKKDYSLATQKANQLKRRYGFVPTQYSTQKNRDTLEERFGFLQKKITIKTPLATVSAIKDGNGEWYKDQEKRLREKRLQKERRRKEKELLSQEDLDFPLVYQKTGN